MAFSIDNLLKNSTSSKDIDQQFENQNRQRSTETIPSYAYPPWSIENRDTNRSSFEIGGSGNVINDVSSTSGPAQMSSTTTSQQLPTLADLQLLFGGGGPKAHYRRNRRSGADRKPRQAYSSKQLEKLEDEFKKDKYLSVSKRVELSKTLNLSETQIKTWFQNRRTKWKKQVTASLRQLYRHGLYSQYAAAAAATNPACYLPMMAPSQAMYETLTAPGLPLDPQPGSSHGHGFPSNSSWNMPNNMFLGLSGMMQGSSMLSGQELKEEIDQIRRSESTDSSCSSSQCD